MRALFAGDAAAAATVAPALASDAPGAAGSTDEDGASDSSGRNQLSDLDAIFGAVSEFSHWSIDEVTRDGDSAAARVILTAEERTARIVVPLSLEDGEWIVDERISVTTTLDFVPLE